MARNKVQGLDRLKRQIGGLPALVVEETARALDAGAQDLTGAIAGACRDDAKLSHSVGWTRGGAPKGAGLASAPLTPGQAVKAEAGLQRTIFAGDKSAFWARWREFGTAPHSLAKGADRSRGGRKQARLKASGAMHPGARAQPFFNPSIRAWKKPMKAKVARAGRNAAKRAAALR